jgi:hypothetical protein
LMIPKPFSKNQLFSALATLLQRPAPPAGTDAAHREQAPIRGV